MRSVNDTEAMALLQVEVTARMRGA